MNWETRLREIIEKRGLTIVGVDGRGKPVPWSDPTLIDIKLYSHTGIYFYRVENLVPADIADIVKTEMIAAGRRHVMKGDL